MFPGKHKNCQQWKVLKTDLFRALLMNKTTIGERKEKPTEVSCNGEKDPYEGTIIMVDIDKIEPNPYQGRSYFDESYIRELARSIEENGLLEPPTGRKHPTKPGITQLATGEQRVRACKLLGWKQIPMIIKNRTD